MPKIKKKSMKNVNISLATVALLLGLILMQSGCSATKRHKTTERATVSQIGYYCGTLEQRDGALWLRDNATYQSYPLLLNSREKEMVAKAQEKLEYNGKDSCVAIELLGVFKPTSIADKNSATTEEAKQLEVEKIITLSLKEAPKKGVTTIAGVYDTPMSGNSRSVLRLRPDYSYQIIEYATDGKNEVTTQGRWYRTEPNKLVLEPNPDKSKAELKSTTNIKIETKAPRATIYAITICGDKVNLAPTKQENGKRGLSFNRVYL